MSMYVASVQSLSLCMLFFVYTSARLAADDVWVPCRLEDFMKHFMKFAGDAMEDRVERSMVGRSLD